MRVRFPLRIMLSLTAGWLQCPLQQFGIAPCGAGISGAVRPAGDSQAVGSPGINNSAFVSSRNTSRPARPPRDNNTGAPENSTSFRPPAHAPSPAVHAVDRSTTPTPLSDAERQHLSWSSHRGYRKGAGFCFHPPGEAGSPRSVNGPRET